MKSIVRALAATLVIMAVSAAVYAADLTLYVKNRPFKGATQMKSGRLCASVDGVLTALGWSWRLTGSQLEIVDAPGGGPDVPGGALTLQFKGKALAAQTFDAGGKALVDVKSLAEGLGLSYTTNAAMGTADLMVPVAAGSVGSTWGRKPEPAQASDGDKSGQDGDKDKGKDGKGKKRKHTGEMVKTDGTNKDSPIQVVRLDFSDTTTPGAKFVGEVRTSTTIKNGSAEDDLDLVKLHLRLVDLAGNIIEEWTQDIGTLKAGQEYSFTPEPPVYYNYNQAKLEAQVEVEHEKVEFEAEAPKDGATEGDSKDATSK